MGCEREGHIAAVVVFLKASATPDLFTAILPSVWVMASQSGQLLSSLRACGLQVGSGLPQRGSPLLRLNFIFFAGNYLSVTSSRSDGLRKRRRSGQPGHNRGDVLLRLERPDFVGASDVGCARRKREREPRTKMNDSRRRETEAPTTCEAKKKTRRKRCCSCRQFTCVP